MPAAHPVGVTCPRCRQLVPYAGRSPGNWVACSCGEHFVLTPRKPDHPERPTNRLASFLTYGLGGAFLLVLPTFLLLCLVALLLVPHLLFLEPTAWALAIAAGVGFLIGGAFGERGVGFIGRMLRSISG